MNSKVVQIRQATGNDLDAIVEVGRRTWPATYGSIYSDDLVQLFLDKWWTAEANVPAIRAGRTFVAEVDGTVVGMASYGPHEGRTVIWKLYVLPDYQGQQLGSWLIQRVLDEIGWSSSAVRMSLSDGNAAAYDFAISHGFVEESREPQGRLPAIIWMVRDLSTHGPRASGPGPAQ
ncbi:MAG TPA: GNAT family N-acetyltransferase [Dermatophilaceae bacterium]|nr:GNAT family N-acetyltransferase [Dermatophilaceae bacterium]